MKKKGVYIVVLLVTTLFCLAITNAANDNNTANTLNGQIITGDSVTGRAASQRISMNISVMNHAPNITSYSPISLVLTAWGNESISFSVTARDPDGPLPYIFWYADNVLKSESNSNSSGFVYTFGCGVSGNHTVKVLAADYINYSLNNFVQWNLTINEVNCFVSSNPARSGGGGGGVTEACIKDWTCSNFGNCYNLEKSLIAGIISREDYRLVKDSCLAKKLDEQSCGFQMRSCSDASLCKDNEKEKTDYQECSYSLTPSCNDGVKNCHDGDCELLTDCGGPCAPCPTCSDGIQNQGEEGVDCGGPCPWSCPAKEQPLSTLARSPFQYLLWIILAILVLFIGSKSVKLIKIGIENKKIKLIYVIFMGILIIIIIFFYYYSRFQIGDFVYKKQVNDVIGEIKNTSLILNPLIQWQDGRYSRESLFSIGKINQLNEEQIKEILKKNNEQDLSVYSWKPGEETNFSEMPIKTVEDLKNYTVRIGEGDCSPIFICGKWSDCQIDYNFNNLEQGNVTSGKEFRYCKDYSGCMSDFVYYKTCEIKEQVTIKEPIGEEKGSIEVYNSEEKLVATITKKKVNNVDRLDINLII